MSVIEQGYRPPFKELPSPKFSKNNISAFQHSSFVLKAIGEALKNGCLKLVSKRPTVVNPISVAVQGNGKKRLICDLRHPNEYLDTQKFKLDDWPRAIPSLSPGMYAFTFDLKKGYYHVNLHPDVQQYFGLSILVGGQTFYAVYTVGPFGLSTLPYLFTKLLKPWVARWRGLGLNIFLYLDDGLAVCNSLRSAQYFSNLVRNDLRRAGIIEQPEKCVWTPRQSGVEWLGLLVDLAEFCLILPWGKIEKSLGAIDDVLRGAVSPRTVLRAAGQIISFALVLGKECLIKTKPLFSFVSGLGNKNWDRSVPLSEEARQCLLYWRDYLPGCSVRKSLQKNPVSCVIFSDASGVGGAAFIEARAINRAPDAADNSLVSVGVTQSLPGRLEEDNKICSDKIVMTGFDQAERDKSSTWREVKTIETALKAWGPMLEGEHLVWHTDNLGGCSVIKKGSMVGELNRLAGSIDRTCRNFDIVLDMRWIRRDKNKIADKLSRFVDLDDWGISQSLLRLAYGLWGTCTVDRFASDQNRKLERFNSRFACEGSEAIDAFSQDWREENNLLVPPPSLIPETIRHLVHSGSRGVLVTPGWKSARFWPMLFPEGRRAWFMKDFRLIRNGGRFLEAGMQPNSIFTSEKFKGDMLLAYLDATNLTLHGYS